MVFYRKYRPQTLDEIIGQASVKHALSAALASGKLSHAYLFCGPRGTGKTSTARILAKIINCEKQNRNAQKQTEGEQSSVSTFTVNPCNKCPACLSITEGSNLDVVEMDAASNRGIDDIRALRETIKLAPTSARKKVYIIDEVHMLSGEAFNALLKTLEEPPNHVLFILATTEIQKIPQTILSRTAKLDFKPATVEELVEAIRKVANAEKLEIKDDALLLLAKKAQGSFRDGIKLLDLLSGFGKIDKKVIEEVFRTGVFEGTCFLLESIAEKDATEALKNLNKELQQGVNIKEFTLSILENLRQMLFIKHGLGEQLVKPEVGEEKFASLQSLAAKFNLNHLVSVINCFQTSLEQSRYSSIPSLPLEMATVESCGTMYDQNEPKVLEEPKVEKIRDEAKTEKYLSPQVQSGESGLDSSANSDLLKISEKWAYVLETVKAYNFSLEALLRSSKLLDCGENSVIIEVPYSFHQRILEAPKSKDLLESIFSDILGRSVRVSTILGQKPIKTEEIANIEVAADDEIVRVAAEIFNSEPN